MKLTQRQKLGIAELLTYKRLITETYPDGIISIVSDTWDFWNVVDPTNGILVQLKDKIMARDGKVVIRPDSGDPVKIVTGYMSDEIVIGEDGKFHEKGDWNGTFDKAGNFKQYREGKELTENEVKGMVQCLYEIFGGTKTSKDYIQLDSHIGAIYGDSITLERATQICERLEAKGFASTNVVFGIGSFTYQGAISPNAIVTRDTHGFAVKSTYGEVLVDGERKGIEIFKDPKTDDGLKKSAKGLTAVYEDDKGGFYMKDQATWDEVKNCAFVPVFKNSKLITEHTFAEIKERVAKNF
jgi:nicotinamide phosphoribosyltransferase|tara:strand:+ start:68 stop:958 length:891 start_codon:yes stop_codon:yes gene_type:complete